MKIDSKWVKPVGLALSLPSTILLAAIGTKELIEQEIVGKTLGFIIFFLIVSNTLFLMVYYGFKNKN